MLLAELADCVSLRLEASVVLSADAADVVFPFCAIPKRVPKQWKNPLAVTVPNGDFRETA
jgi:hypothetical protein